MLPSNHSFSQYCDSCKRATTIAVAIVGRAITKWKQYRKEAMNQSKTHTKNKAKRLRATTFAIALKVGREITKWGAIEKRPILLSQYWKNYHF